jgi:hypothetical protein
MCAPLLERLVVARVQTAVVRRIYIYMVNRPRLIAALRVQVAFVNIEESALLLRVRELRSVKLIGSSLI